MVFDPAALQFVSGAAVDPGLPPPALFAQLSAPAPVPGAPGSLSALEAGVLGATLGDGQLIGQFSFVALESGPTTLDLVTNFAVAVQGQGGQVVFDDPASGSATVAGGRTPIPLPAPAFLLMAGLSALRLARFRRPGR